jgi:hypothetical protein
MYFGKPTAATSTEPAAICQMSRGVVEEAAVAFELNIQLSLEVGVVRLWLRHR